MMRQLVWGALFLSLGIRSGWAQDEPGMRLHNATLGQLVDDCQRQTKKRFIYDDQVNQTFMQRRIHVISPQLPRDNEEYFAIFQSVLQINGLVLVPFGKPGEEFYKIVPQQPNANRQAIPVVREDKAPNDTYMTRIFRLEHAEPREVHAALLNLTMPQSVIVLESARSIVLTDYDYNIKRFEEIIKELDKERPDIDFKMVPLKRALASDVQQILNDLAQTLFQRTKGGMQPGIPGMPGQEAVKIAADKRTNSIVILAEPSRMKQILDLVAKLDSEAPFETSGIYIVHLRHTSAPDIAKTLNSLYKISTDATSGAPSGGTTALPGQPIAPTLSGPSTTGLSGATAPTIVPDVRANSIIMITDRNTAAELERIIRRLDQRRPQVLIKASVVEVRATDNFDLGIELGRAVDPDNRVTTFLRAQYGQSTIVPSGNTFDIVPVDSQGLTLALVHDRIGNVGAMLKAISEKANVSILDEPEVATLDNGFARISVKTQEPVTQTTLAGPAGATPITTFKEFVDAETILEISPHISEGNYLQLQTRLKIEKFVGVSSDPQLPPRKASREIDTKAILVPNGRTVVIGGIVTQDEAETVTKIPFLGDIPILGHLFRRTQQREEKRTLYIFITPTILYDDSFADLKELTEQRKEQIEQLRGKALYGLMVQGRGDPVPISTFRYVSPVPDED